MTAVATAAAVLPMAIGPKVKHPDPIIIGIMGDSISTPDAGPSGIAHHAWWQYIDDLEPSVTFTSNAFPGARVAGQGLEGFWDFQAQLDALLALPKAERPERIWAMGGVNDLFAGTTAFEINAAMAAMQLQAAGDGVVLQWIQPPPVLGDPSWAAPMAELEVDLKPAVSWDEGDWLEEIGDPIHLTGKAHWKLAQEMWGEL